MISDGTWVHFEEGEFYHAVGSSADASEMLWNLQSDLSV